MMEKSILLIDEIQGDTLTPISIFQRLSGKKKFLLESSLKHEDSGRFSIIGCDPTFEVIGKGLETTILEGEKREIRKGRALDLISEFLPEKKRHFPFNCQLMQVLLDMLGMTISDFMKTLAQKQRMKSESQMCILCFLKI